MWDNLVSRLMSGGVGHLRRSLPVLDTIITLALLLSVLGTVTGMISAFDIMSEAGLGQPQAVRVGSPKLSLPPRPALP